MKSSPLLSLSEKSIAVLPFINISTDPDNEYFSDGMTEEIINALSKIEGLKVTARTSSFAFKGKQMDVRIIGNQLGVSSVLEGSIRKSGDRLRITTQLVRTDNGFQIWSAHYDRKLVDVFELQDEISLLIAEKIRENFGHFSIQEHLVKPETSNIEAYQAYLKGRFYQLKWNQEGFVTAVENYKTSIQADHSYPMPYLGLSLCYTYLASWNFMPRKEGYQQAQFYLEKIPGNHQSLAAYHFVLATLKLWGTWEFTEAKTHLLRCLEISPNDTDALEAMAEMYTAQGDFGEAKFYINKALAINPLSPNHHYTLGNIYYLSKEFQKSIQSMNQSIHLDNSWVLAAQIKACSLIMLQDESGLKQHCDKLSKSERQAFELLYALKYHQQQQEITFDLETLDQGYIPWQVYFYIYQEEIPKALEKLHWGVQNRIGQYIGFANDPLLEPLKDQTLYQQLISKTILKSEVANKINHQKPEKALPLLDAEQAEEYLKAIETSMKEEKLFLQTDLSLKSLAEYIHLNPNKLSWLINDKIGKNFNELINGYRIQAFMQKAVDPTNKHLTILGLAYESGFNSKSVFNEFFKRSTGLTPKAWLKKQ